MTQPLHWPPPPYEWHVLREHDDAEEWKLQWKHFEPLLASCGYTVTWADIGIGLNATEPPRGWQLPPAADPFFPKPNECFVAFPMSRPLSASTSHVRVPADRELTQLKTTQPLVRVANDPHERPVAIKAMLASSREYAILRHLHSLRLEAPDPADHTILVLDAIVVEDTVFVVMPKWSEANVPFWRLHEVLDHFEECLQGLVFMHNHRIAHLDWTNIEDLVDLHTPTLRALTDAMTSQDPLSRPTADIALRTLRNIRSKTPRDALGVHVELKKGVELPAHREWWDQDTWPQRLRERRSEEAEVQKSDAPG
ncbi:hypothetical protein AURDEDRAFT_162755 [Auricularia subglabra TFB-10046 SS5]|nr:hypothetical protein AURDEDRAFT_162755 [Auricularia subglabra TFB-10046 SS5]